MLMKTIKFFFLFIISSFLFFNSCKQATKEDAYDKAIKSEDELINSKDFDNYYTLFFKLSNQNTKTELPYVNNFMKENSLWKFKNVCDLLENSKVKADSTVFNYWKIRCDFQNARQYLMDTYGLDSDSLKILMEHAVSEKQIPQNINN